MLSPNWTSVPWRWTTAPASHWLIFGSGFAVTNETSPKNIQIAPLGLIVIDYLQLMKAPNLGSGANREQQVAYISKGLKALAKEEELCVLALAQLNRGVEKEGALSDDGKTKKKREPVLSDLRESGSIEQDADAVLAVHHPDDDDDEADANRAPGDPNNAVLLC